MGQDWKLLRPFAFITSKGVPVVALLLQTGISMLLLGFGGFERVLTYIEFTLSLSTSLTVAGVIWLRWKMPHLQRPFKCPAHPWVPILFLTATGYAMFRFATDPKQWLPSLLGLLTVGSGALVYLLARKREDEEK